MRRSKIGRVPSSMAARRCWSRGEASTPHCVPSSTPAARRNGSRGGTAAARGDGNWQKGAARIASRQGSLQPSYGDSVWHSHSDGYGSWQSAGYGWDEGGQNDDEADVLGAINELADLVKSTADEHRRKLDCVVGIINTLAAAQMSVVNASVEQLELGFSHAVRQREVNHGFLEKKLGTLDDAVEKVSARQVHAALGIEVDDGLKELALKVDVIAATLDGLGGTLDDMVVAGVSRGREQAAECAKERELLMKVDAMTAMLDGLGGTLNGLVAAGVSRGREQAAECAKERELLMKVDAMTAMLVKLDDSYWLGGCGTANPPHVEPRGGGLVGSAGDGAGGHVWGCGLGNTVGCFGDSPSPSMDARGCFGVSPPPLDKVENMMNSGCLGVSPSPVIGAGCLGVSPSPSANALHHKVDLGCIGVSPSPFKNALESKMDQGCFGVSPSPPLDDEPEITVPLGSCSSRALAASLM